MQHARCAASIATVVLLGTAAVAGPPRYAAIAFRALPHSYGRAVSTGGHLAGNTDLGEESGAFIVGPSGLAFYPHSTGRGLHAYGVNGFGVGVGEEDTPSAISPAIFEPDGSVRTFSPFGGNRGIAYGINDAGWIVGSANSVAAPETFRAFQWRDGNQQALGIPPGYEHSLASQITSGGLVTGKFDTPSGRITPGTWTNGIPSVLDLPVGYVSGIARGASDHGVVAGDVWDSSFEHSHAAAWINGVPIVLPDLGGAFSSASGVDQSGLIAGTVEGPGPGAALWGVTWWEGDLYRLDDLLVGSPGLRIYAASGISENGYISAVAIDGADYNYAVLLVPVPGPHAFWVLATGAAIGMARRRR